MSGILKTYFGGRKIKNLNNSACKYLTTYNDNLRLLNSGLHLTENNILRIKKYYPNSTTINKTTSTYQNCNTEANTINAKNVYPKINNESFYEKAFFSNILKKKQNKKISSNNMFKLFPDLTENKNTSITKIKEKNDQRENNKNNISIFPFCSSNRLYKVEVTNFDIYVKDKKDKSKSLTTKEDNKTNSVQVEKIVHSLINSNNSDNNKKKLHHASSTEKLSLKKKEYKKDDYPKEKSISPMTYIDYNLKTNPGNRNLFKSFDTQIKCINNKIQYREKILNQVDTNYRNRLKVESLKNEHNDNYYMNNNKKKINEIFLQNKNYNKKNLHFNINNYYNNINKIKANGRYQFDQKFIKLQKVLKNKINLLTFDKKMKNVENSMITAIKHLDNLSISNRKMMKNVLNIYNVYDLYDK